MIDDINNFCSRCRMHRELPYWSFDGVCGDCYFIVIEDLRRESLKEQEAYGMPSIERIQKALELLEEELPGIGNDHYETFLEFLNGEITEDGPWVYADEDGDLRYLKDRYGCVIWKDSKEFKSGSCFIGRGYKSAADCD